MLQHFRNSTWRSDRAKRRSGLLTLRLSFVITALVLTDLTSALLAILGADYLHVLFGAEQSVLISAGRATLFFLLLWPLMYLHEGLYPGYGITAIQHLRKQVVGTFYVGFIILGISLFVSEFILLPVIFTVLATAIGMVISPVLKHLTKRGLSSLGLWGSPVVIIGANSTGKLVAEVMKSRPLVGLNPVAFFDHNPEQVGRSLAGVPVRGTLEDAQHFIESRGLKHVFVTHTGLPDHGLKLTVGRQGGTPKKLKFISDLSSLETTQRYASGLHNMMTLDVRNNLGSKVNRAVKRTVDIVGSGLALLLLFPVLAAIYTWIRLDSPGPALYRSKRVGQRGEPFWCFKFRSMHLDAETQLERLFEQDPRYRLEYEMFHKLNDDPRITRAGQVLRKYSLDELPQLLNVFIGEMSLVGPRPYLMNELVNIPESNKIVFEAKPGMTGHWQVSERNNVRFEERLWMEEHYVRNWSVWWDFILLCETVQVVIKPNGAR